MVKLDGKTGLKTTSQGQGVDRETDLSLCHVLGKT
jgi:hypothetical protein